MKKYYSIQNIIVVFFFGIIFLNHQFAFFGYYGYDDMEYAFLSQQISKGELNLLEDHFAYRWGLIAPVGLIYKWSCINDFTTAIWSMVISCLLIIVISDTIKKYGNSVLFLGLILFTLNTEILLWTDKLMPDIHFTLYVICAFLSINAYRKSPNQPVLFSFLFSIFIFLAFLTKELIWLLTPIYAVLFIIDIITKKKLIFWWMTILFSLAISIIYFYSIYLETGHFLTRLHIILKNKYLNNCSYDQLPIIETIKRITYLPIMSFINSGFIVSIIFFISTLFTLKLNPFQAKDQTEQSFWIKCYCFALLSIWFTSISFKSYVPMCPDSRHFIYIIPLSLFAIAPSLSQNFKNVKFILINLALFISVYLTTLIMHSNNSYYYLIIIIAFILVLIFRNKIKNTIAIYCTIVFLYFCYQFYLSYRYAIDTCYKQQKELIENNFGNINHKSIVITNEVQERTGNFYLKFNNSKTEFVNFSEMTKFDYSKVDSIYLLTNYHTEFYSSINEKDKPNIIRNTPKEFRLIYQYNSIKLYSIPSDFFLHAEFNSTKK